MNNGSIVIYNVVHKGKRAPSVAGCRISTNMKKHIEEWKAYLEIILLITMKRENKTQRGRIIVYTPTQNEKVAYNQQTRPCIAADLLC